MGRQGSSGADREEGQHESGATSVLWLSQGSAQLFKEAQVTATHTPWLPGSGKTAVWPGGKDQGLRQYLWWPPVEEWKERAFLVLSLPHRLLVEGGKIPRNPGLPALSWDPTLGTRPIPTLRVGWPSLPGKGRPPISPVMNPWVQVANTLHGRKEAAARESDTELWRSGGQEVRTGFLGSEPECWQRHTSLKVLENPFPRLSQTQNCIPHIFWPRLLPSKPKG